ncbi:MAG: AMP-binding protein [Symploca sp. SIO2D2]|nr:AMP-binding protein [Symploca sp. SIO2D2]
MPECQLQNQYGPSESHVVSAFNLTSEVSSWPLLPPIGRPIDNSQIYLLDRVGKLVPVGVAGELYIGGVSIAQGYWNKPELTAERFIANPFAEGRLYKTGDLARYLPDGNIEYLGRIDHQVKIRGFRIELGEVEAVLSEHPLVKQAVTTVHKFANGDKRLVAYFVSQDNAPLQTQALRQYLQERLPAYMVPSLFVPLEALPLTPSGKVARQTLSLPEAEYSSSDESYVAPRTHQEAWLCHIYSQLLQIGSIGIHDNFFDLGGHSLLAIQLMARIQSQFQVQLPLIALFQAPTPAKLAQWLNPSNNEQAASLLSWPSLVPLQTQGNQPPVFFVPGAGGNVIYLNSLAKSIEPKRPFYGLQSKGLNGLEDCDDSVKAMASRYIDAIRSVQSQGPYHLAGHSFGALVAYEMACQLQTQGETIALVTLVDVGAPRTHKYGQPQLEEWQWLTMLIREVEDLYGRKIEVPSQVIQQMPNEAAQYEYILSKLVEVDIFPEGTLKQQLQGFMRVRKTHSQIQREYTVNPTEVPKVPLRLIRATEEIFAEEIKESEEEWKYYQKEDWGWQDYSGIPMKVIWVSGNHYTMMASPHVELIAQHL